MRLLSLCSIVFVLLVAPAYAPASAATVDQAVTDTRAFVEWSLGFRLDPAGVQAIRDGITTDMASDQAGSQAVVNDMNTVMAWVHGHSTADSELLRSLIEPQLIAAWQADTSASAATGKTLVAEWRQHHQIVADGTPPLRASVVNSYIAMFKFLSKEAGKPVPAAVANRTQFTQRVASLYSSASPADQMKFNKVQTLWLSLKEAWNNATPAEQAAMRQYWRTGRTTAVVPMPTAKPGSGFTGQTWTVDHWKEHLFVESQSESIMSNWSNPF